MALAKKRGKKSKRKEPKLVIPNLGKGGHRKDNPNLTPVETPTKKGYSFRRYKRYNVAQLGDKDVDITHSFEFEGKKTLETLKKAGIILDYDGNGANVVFNERLLQELGFDEFARLFNKQTPLKLDVYVKGRAITFTLEPKYYKDIDFNEGGTYSVSLDIVNMANMDSNPFIEATLEYISIPEKYMGQGKGLEIFTRFVKGLKKVAKAKGKEGVNIGLLADIESGYWTWLRYGFMLAGGKSLSQSERGRLFIRYIKALEKEFNDKKDDILKFINENIDYRDDFISEYFDKGKGIWFEFLMVDLLQMRYGLSEKGAIAKYKSIFKKYRIDYIGFFRFSNNDTPDTNYSLQMLADVYYGKFGKELEI